MFFEVGFSNGIQSRNYLPSKTYSSTSFIKVIQTQLVRCLTRMAKNFLMT